MPRTAPDRRPTATARRIMIVAAAVIATTIAAVPLATWAKPPVHATPTRPVRFEGYWNRSHGAPGVLEDLTFTSEIGGPYRPFGVTHMQAYKPDEQGLEVFRQSGLLPSIRVMGNHDMVARFITAPETQKVVVYGVYRPDAATLTLNSVEVGGHT